MSGLHFCACIRVHAQGHLRLHGLHVFVHAWMQSSTLKDGACVLTTVPTTVLLPSHPLCPPPLQHLRVPDDGGGARALPAAPEVILRCLLLHLTRQPLQCQAHVYRGHFRMSCIGSEAQLASASLTPCLAAFQGAHTLPLSPLPMQTRLPPSLQVAVRQACPVRRMANKTWIFAYEQGCADAASTSRTHARLQPP